MAALRKLLEIRDTAAVEDYPAGISDIDHLMRKVFDRPATVPASLPVAAASATQPRRDPELAFDLLDRAARAFDVLLHRSQQLEAQMNEAAERSRTELAAQQRIAEDWKKLATGMKAHVEETERRLATMKAHSEEATARAFAAEARGADLMEASRVAALQAEAAESRLTEFNNKVLASFGSGARAHAALAIGATSSVHSAPAAAA